MERFPLSMQTFRVSATGGINSQKRASRDLSPDTPSDVGMDSLFGALSASTVRPSLKSRSAGSPRIRIFASRRCTVVVKAATPVPAFRRSSPYWWPARPTAPGSLVVRELRKRIDLAQP